MSIYHTADNNVVQTQLSICLWKYKFMKLYIRPLQVHMEESIFTQFELKEQHPLSNIYVLFTKGYTFRVIIL